MSDTTGGGTLLQLVAQGAQNVSMNIRNVAHEYYTYKSEGLNGIQILRNADIITPEYLELEFTNPNIDNLNLVKNLLLSMTIGGLIQQFPLSLLINLNEPVICEQKMYINLCFNMLFGEIKAIGLANHDTNFDIKTINNERLDFINSYGIVAKFTYLDTEERHQINQNTFEELIQQISFINVKADINDDRQTSDIYELRNLAFNNISKGLFIECDNEDKLNNEK